LPLRHHIESNPGPNIVSGKPNLKNGSLKIAHINACSLLPKIELEMSNNDIILGINSAIQFSRERTRCSISFAFISGIPTSADTKRSIVSLLLSAHTAFKTRHNTSRRQNYRN
jgi:hypothetical protein